MSANFGAQVLDAFIAVIYCLIAGAGICVVRCFGPFSLSSYRVEDDYDVESSKENIRYRILAPSLFCIVAVLAVNGLAGLLFGEFGTLASFAPTIMYWVMLSVIKGWGCGLKVGPSSDGRIGVRMYGRARIEEALGALSLGFSASQAAELAGVSASVVQKWRHGVLPRSWDGAGRGAGIGATESRGEVAGMGCAQRPVRPAGERTARRPDARPGGEPAAQGGVGRPKRGSLAPGFDVEREQVRARREIEAGDRPAPPLRHRFLEDLEELL